MYLAHVILLCSWGIALGSKPKTRADVCLNPAWRFGIIVQIAAQHGSTAMLQYLWSSNQLAQVCSAEGWQCECKGKYNSSGERGENIEEHLLTESFKWYNDGRHKKLLTIVKGANPEAYLEDFNSVEATTDHYMSGKMSDIFATIILPKLQVIDQFNDGKASDAFKQVAAANNVEYIRPSMIFVWRPYCLMPLSSLTVRKLEKNRTSVDIALLWELYGSQYGMTAIDHMYSTRGKNDILVVNYASFITEEIRTTDRFKSFFPCTNISFSHQFIPDPNELYEGNKWKPRGTIHDFGSSVDLASMGYDHKSQQCDSAIFLQYLSKMKLLYTFSPEQKFIIRRLDAAMAYLSKFD